ncbi:DUF1003 domain-containing protein [Xylophilus sp. Kf1]|nr:DUF1003 domain-containing protein [Xylophilus sp. Kf1]
MSTPPDLTTSVRNSHPNVGSITRENIASILDIEQQRRESKPGWYRVVERTARFCGTIGFLWMNLAWFAAWIGFNLLGRPFDPYPFTFLILVVSLEAIVLSILILISQNLSAVENERRHHLDLQINLLNEREMTALLRLVTLMADRMGISHADQAEVDALACDTDPAEVLREIVEAEHAHANALFGGRRHPPPPRAGG